MNEIEVNKLVYALGGAENIKEVAYCNSRLRFFVKNMEKVCVPELDNEQECMVVHYKKNEVQCILGPKAKSVYQKLIENGIINNKGDSSKKIPFLTKTMEWTADLIQPLVPFYFIAVVLVFIVFMMDSQERVIGQLVWLDWLGCSIFAFFPLLVAIVYCDKFNGNVMYSVLVVAILFRMPLINGSETITSGLGNSTIEGNGYWCSFLLLCLTLWLVNYLHQWIIGEKKGRLLKLCYPGIILMILFAFLLLVLEPVCYFLSKCFEVFIYLLYYWNPAVSIMVVGLLSPFLLIAGIFYGLLPIGTTMMEQLGYDFLFGPAIYCMVIAQGASALAVALKSKDKEWRVISYIAAFCSFIGFSDLAILCVNMRGRKSLWNAMIGTAAGSLFFGMFGIVKIGSQLPGILSFLSFRKLGTNNDFVFIFIGTIITFAIAFLLTFFGGFTDFVRHEEEVGVATDHTVKRETIINNSDFDRLQGEVIYSPMDGRSIPLSHVNDMVYAKEMLGKGVAILPYSGKVYAPVKGQVILIFDTLQGIGIQSEYGAEIFIHIGLDTSYTNGKYMKSYVKKYDLVEPGQLILEFDLARLKKEGYDVVTPITICNTQEYRQVVSLIHQDVQKLQPFTKLIK